MLSLRVLKIWHWLLLEDRLRHLIVRVYKVLLGLLLVLISLIPIMIIWMSSSLAVLPIIQEIIISMISILLVRLLLIIESFLILSFLLLLLMRKHFWILSFQFFMLFLASRLLLFLLSADLRPITWVALIFVLMQLFSSHIKYMLGIIVLLLIEALFLQI